MPTFVLRLGDEVKNVMYGRQFDVVALFNRVAYCSHYNVQHVSYKQTHPHLREHAHIVA